MALVLAAGSSRRMGASNKLLSDLHGEPLLRHTLRSVGAFGLGSVLVVTGHEAETVANIARSEGFEVCHNASYADGMGSSIAAGARALPATRRAVLICLADMPFIKPETVEGLLAAMAATVDGEACIAVPTYSGQRGHPVLFGRRFVPNLARLEGDRGARNVLRDHSARVVEVAVDDPAICIDIDTPSDLEAIQTVETVQSGRKPP